MRLGILQNGSGGPANADVVSIAAVVKT